MKFQIVIALLFSLALYSCGGQGSGFAPSSPPSQPATGDVSNDSTFKYGESVTTATGWEASLDTTDPVQQTVLANGWTAEVKNE